MADIRILPTDGELRLNKEPLDLAAWLTANGVDPSEVREPRFHRPDPSQVIHVPRARPTGDRIARARFWLERQAGAVEGQEGSTATARIAHCLVQGFGLSADGELFLMMDWNQTCSPPWSEEEIKRRIEYAGEHPIAAKVRGYMLERRADRRGRDREDEGRYRDAFIYSSYVNVIKTLNRVDSVSSFPACRGRGGAPRILPWVRGTYSVGAAGLVDNRRGSSVKPFAYIRDVVVRVSPHPASRLAKMLPEVWEPAPP